MLFYLKVTYNQLFFYVFFFYCVLCFIFFEKTIKPICFNILAHILNYRCFYLLLFYVILILFLIKFKYLEVPGRQSELLLYFTVPNFVKFQHRVVWAKLIKKKNLESLCARIVSFLHKIKGPNFILQQKLYF